MQLNPWPSPLAEGGPMPPYTNVTTNTTYILNTKKMNFSTAEQFCNDNGAEPLPLLPFCGNTKKDWVAVTALAPAAAVRRRPPGQLGNKGGAD
jgi:hypothetical protein